MRILFLSHYFPPEVNAPAIRTFEHCREWVRTGHEVHVVTCVPSHPRGVPFPGYSRRWYDRSLLDGIHVHRVWTYLAANTGVFKRTLNYLSFVPTSVWRSLKLGKFDVIVATSPQIFNAVAGRLAGTLTRTPWVFELRDLWPESAAAVGAVRNSWILRLTEQLELSLYRSALAVVCVSRAFIDNLTGRGIPGSRIEYVPNGIDVESWKAGDARVVRRLHGMKDDDVLVSYIGTVGMAHGLEVLPAAAASLQRTHPHVRFLVVGDGAELSSVRAHAEAMRLTNVEFTGLVPHETVRDYMAATDISLVVLRGSELFKTVLPSKMFEAMGAGKPIVLGVQGEARRILELSGGGIAVAPEDGAALASAIMKLSDNRALRRKMGNAGRSFATREFNRRDWARRYADILKERVRGPGDD